MKTVPQSTRHKELCFGVVVEISREEHLIFRWSLVDQKIIIFLSKNGGALRKIVFSGYLNA